jgi:HD-GYP domain-containing protein (c-di-GMP phosphodiesterase class II)
LTRALVAAIDQKDHYTRGHSERVGMLSRLVGRELGLSRAELQDLEWAGLLHDVGKIGIPEVILSKPGRLSLTEFESIKRHPRIGYEILRPIASFERVLTGVLHHHEQPDGNGYPSGLRGDAVPLIARIIHVADTFDALTSTRSYRRAFQVERACEIMRQDAGSRLDAGVIDVFLRVLEAYRQADPGGFAANFIAQREFEDVESGRPTVYAGGQSG